MSAPKAKLELVSDGQVARIVLDAPEANVLDKAMMGDLARALDRLEGERNLKAMVLTAEGPHFSFGASIPEHLPDRIRETLACLGGLLRQLAGVPAPTIAAVRGQCLGGGFELVLACDLILAEEGARLGCPEIKLGVFPPAAAALLPPRIGAGPATALVLTGRSLTGSEAATAGLVARTAPEGDLEKSLSRWLEKDFLPRSACALRHACLAARRPLKEALDNDLPGLERLYLDDLMKEPDACEGIRAFLEKREPRWSRGRETG